MVDVTFVLDGGERISADELNERPFDPVERVMLLAARNHIRRRLDKLSCPRHGQPPRVIASGPSPDRLSVSIHGCCHEFVDDATTTLSSGGSLYTQEDPPGT